MKCADGSGNRMMAFDMVRRKSPHRRVAKEYVLSIVSLRTLGPDHL
jgi:hypothetical protein